MNKKLIKAALVSTIMATGTAGFASAASVPVTSPASVKICKTITNVYDNTTATFDYTFTAGSTGLTGLPAGASIAFSNAAHTNNELSKCVFFVCLLPYLKLRYEYYI